MKLVIFGAIATVVGLAGGTGARVFTAPALPVGADSLIAAADSMYRLKASHGATGHAIAHADSAAVASHGDAAHTDTAPAAHGPQGGEPAAKEAAHAESPAAEAAAVSATVGPAPVAAPGPERYKQVGNILLNMKPVEAARVIAYLTDTQVHGLLEAMGPRQAAQILSQLPAERAATLSKRLLIAPPTEAR